MELTTLEQHAMLAIIALRDNAYGISIQDHIAWQAGYEPSVGSIYAALDRLEEKGFVRSKQGEATRERGGRRKLYFSVTAPGRKTLKELLRAVGSLSSSSALAGGAGMSAYRIIGTFKTRTEAVAWAKGETESEVFLKIAGYI